MHRFSLIAAIAVVVPCSTGSAQQADPIEPGSWLRVTQVCDEEYAGTSSDHRVDCPAHIGLFTTKTADSIVLTVEDGESNLVVPIASVTSVELFRGKRRRTGRGALLGLAIGAGLGAIDGAVNQGGWVTSMPCFDNCPSRLRSAAGGAVLFGVPGLLIGTIVGSLIETDRWEEMPLDQLRASITTYPDGGAVGFRYKIEF